MCPHLRAIVTCCRRRTGLPSQQRYWRSVFGFHSLFRLLLCLSVCFFFLLPCTPLWFVKCVLRRSWLTSYLPDRDGYLFTPKPKTTELHWCPSNSLIQHNKLSGSQAISVFQSAVCRPFPLPLPTPAPHPHILLSITAPLLYDRLPSCGMPF